MSRRKLTNTCTYNFKSKKTTMLEDGFMNYFSVPSLQSIAIVKIVAELWKQPVLNCGIAEKDFVHMAKNISEKLDFLPYLLRDKASNINELMRMQMLKWFQNQNYIHYTPQYSICWTMEGTVDKVKTLALLISDENFLLIGNKNSEYFTKIYIAACTYCAEDHIATLWKYVSNQKSTQDEISFLSKYVSKGHHLIAYWTCYAKNEWEMLSSIIKSSDRKSIFGLNMTVKHQSVNENMFTLSLAEGNALAVKYFWNKLTYKKINNNLMRWTVNVIQSLYNCRAGPNPGRFDRWYNSSMWLQTKDVFLDEITQRCRDYRMPWELADHFTPPCNGEANEYTDILCFLLSQMNDKWQQSKIFRKYSGKILSALYFDLKWQKFLLPTIQVMWGFLEEKIYVKFLLTVLKNAKARNMKLLKELWGESPIHLKRCLIQYIKNSGGKCVYSLCEYDDVETIKVILNDVTPEENNLIILTAVEYKKCDLIYTDKLAILEMLVQDTFSLKCEIDNVKEHLIKQYGDNLCCRWIGHDKWQLVEKFLDWGFTSQDQIDQFKKEIAYDICRCFILKGDYEKVDKFMKWCFSSDEEISHFKNEFTHCKNKNIQLMIEMFNGENWSLFEKFVSWCFKSDEELNKFKINVSSIDTIASIIDYLIPNNFAFVNKFIVWCFSSEEEINNFKKEFMISEVGIKIFDECIQYKLSELLDWYYPIQREVVISAFLKGSKK